jgi:hypothetical protein
MRYNAREWRIGKQQRAHESEQPITNYPPPFTRQNQIKVRTGMLSRSLSNGYYYVQWIIEAVCRSISPVKTQAYQEAFARNWHKKAR